MYQWRTRYLAEGLNGLTDRQRPGCEQPQAQHHENPDGALDLVNNHKSEIRRELGKRIGKQVRIVPEIAFFHDDSSDYASRMDKLIAGLEIPEESNNEEEENQ